MAKIGNKLSKGIKSVSGLSTEKILSMDIYQLDKKSLRAVTNRLISTANKRLRRLYNKAPNSPALRPHLTGVNKLLEQFTLKGAKTRNQVEMVVKEVKAFLNASTSTLKGFNDFREDITQRIGEFEDIDAENDFWNLYKEWVKTHKNQKANFNDSNLLLSTLYDSYIVKNKSKRGAKYSLTKLVNDALKSHVKQFNEESRKLESDLLNSNAIRGKKEF